MNEFNALLNLGLIVICAVQCNARAAELNTGTNSEEDHVNIIKILGDNTNHLNKNAPEIQESREAPIDDEFGCRGQLGDKLIEEIASYKPTADRIIDILTKGELKHKVYDELATFVDVFGARLTGTENLENSIDYLINLFNNSGIEHITTENVTVPVWLRHDESLELVKPRNLKLPLIGLGGSVGTPTEGITAEVLVVRNFEELTQRSADAKDKIVVFNTKWMGYGQTVKYRSQGASAAAEYGAVAALIKSVTPFSINSPHTGGMHYITDKKIPTAAITVEHADMLQRMHNRGTNITLKLIMNAKEYPSAISRNLIADLKGTEEPEKIIIVSGHIDSWDVGQGAMDDAGGAFISWYALKVLKTLGLKPRRTVRAIMWTAEEQGLYGAISYRNRHINETENIVLGMESDYGTFDPTGLSFSGSNESTCIMREIMKLLAPMNASQLSSPGEVSDLGVFRQDNVPLAGITTKNERYFWFHHAEGDMMTVENPEELDRCTALWTTVAYIVADMNITLPKEIGPNPNGVES